MSVRPATKTRVTVVKDSSVPERVRLLRRIRQARARARKAGRVFSLTYEDVHRIHHDPCFYCGTPDAGEIDRFDNGVGYVATNCVSACEACNSAKGRKPTLVFLAYPSRQLKLI